MDTKRNYDTRKHGLELLLGLAILLIGSYPSALFGQSHPSGFISRILVLVQNPTGVNSAGTPVIMPQYSLQIENAALAAGNPSSTPFKWPVISGWTSGFPASIENLAASNIGAVTNEDGTLTLLDYVHETVTTANASTLAPTAGTILSPSLRYVMSANKQAGELTIIDRVNSPNSPVTLNLAGVSGISMNPGTSVALVFADDSNIVYMVRHLSQTDETAYANGKWPANAVDCEPYNLPAFCLISVAPSGTTGAAYSTNFDKPFKAVSSGDGGSMYVLSAGPEADGKTAEVTVLPLAPLALEDGTQSGSVPTTPVIYPVPGGVDDGIVGGNYLYLAGQGLITSPTALWAGQLTVVNTSTGTVQRPQPMADGTPVRMALADDNTLWIGSIRCNTGANQFFSSSNTLTGSNSGCLTVVNTSTQSVAYVEPRLCDLDSGTTCASSGSTPMLNYGTGGSGDITGIAPIPGSHLVYYVELGQVHARSTVFTSTAAGYQLVSSKSVSTNDNYNNVTVSGTAVDIVYMDSASNTDGTSTSTIR